MKRLRFRDLYKELLEKDPVLALELARLEDRYTRTVYLTSIPQRRFFVPKTKEDLLFLGELLEAEKEEKIYRLKLLYEKRSNIKGHTPLIAIRTINEIIETPYLQPFPSFELFFIKKSNEAEVRERLEEVEEAEKKIIDEARNDLLLTESSIERFSDLYELIGNTLNYPVCCIRNFAKLKGNSRKYQLKHLKMDEKRDLRTRREHRSPLNAETYIGISDAEEGKWHYFIKFLHELRVDDIPEAFYSRFTRGFYPCRSRCPEAIARGKEYEDVMDSNELKLYYRVLLITQHLVGLMPEYQMFKEYRRLGKPDEIKKIHGPPFSFFERLGGKEMKKIEDLEGMSPDRILKHLIELTTHRNHPNRH